METTVFDPNIFSSIDNFRRDFPINIQNIPLIKKSYNLKDQKYRNFEDLLQTPSEEEIIQTVDSLDMNSIFEEYQILFIRYNILRKRFNNRSRELSKQYTNLKIENNQLCKFEKISDENVKIELSNLTYNRRIINRCLISIENSLYTLRQRMFLAQVITITDEEFKSIYTRKILENVVDCSICFFEMYETAKLQCSHIFHEKCIKQWLTKSKGTCPICRKIYYKINTETWDDIINSIKQIINNSLYYKADIGSLQYPVMDNSQILETNGAGILSLPVIRDNDMMEYSSLGVLNRRNQDYFGLIRPESGTYSDTSWTFRPVWEAPANPSGSFNFSRISENSFGFPTL
jgi:hypothetical protein